MQHVHVWSSFSISSLWSWRNDSVVKNSSLTEKPGSVVSGGEPWCWFLWPGGMFSLNTFTPSGNVRCSRLTLQTSCSGLRPFLQGLFCGICTLLWRSYSGRAYFFYLEIMGTGRTRIQFRVHTSILLLLKTSDKGKVKLEGNKRDAWMILMWAECPLAQPANLHNCHSSPAHASLAYGLSLFLSESWSGKGSALLPPTWRGDRSPNRLIPRVILWYCVCVWGGGLCCP